MLVDETRKAVSDYTFLGISIDPATDPDHQDFKRITAEIPVSRQFFDAFLSGRGGYRAQYALGVEPGERFNRVAADALAGVLIPLEKYYLGDLDRALCERSFNGPHTKLWFPKEVSAVEHADYLSDLPETICWAPWTTYWAKKTPPRKGLLAPQPEATSILINGTFVESVGWNFWNQKPGRSQELNDSGWV